MNGCDKKQGHKILPAQHYKLAMAEWWQICQFLKVRGLGESQRLEFENLKFRNFKLDYKLPRCN